MSRTELTNSHQPSFIFVELFNDLTGTGVEARLLDTGTGISITSSRFGNLGTGVTANRGRVSSGFGSCNIFKDANHAQQVATITNGGGDAWFLPTKLQGGAIVCRR